eukprot:3177145-Rhodomonas_salina.2
MPYAEQVHVILPINKHAILWLKLAKGVLLSSWGTCHDERVEGQLSCSRYSAAYKTIVQS